MSVLAEVGSTWPGKVAPFVEVTSRHFGASDVQVGRHDTGSRNRAPKQPMSRRSLELGAGERLLATLDDMRNAGTYPEAGKSIEPTAVGGAECGVIFSLKDSQGKVRPGFFSQTVAAVAVFDASGVRFGVGRDGGTRYPARDVVRAWVTRSTVGEAMSRRLGGDPQDPHAMLGQGRRADQVRRAYEAAFADLEPVTTVAAGNTAK